MRPLKRRKLLDINGTEKFGRSTYLRERRSGGEDAAAASSTGMMRWRSLSWSCENTMAMKMVVKSVHCEHSVLETFGAGL